MTKKIKLLTVVGTRPELIRLSSFIKKSDSFFNNIIVHTGQNYDFNLNKIFFDDLNLKEPKYFLKLSGNSTIETISNILVNIEKIILQEKPDAFLILGDTNSCLSIYVAKRYKIPTFHVEAGNRCFDQRVPEEINRKIIDSIADINITYSSISRNYLIRENFPPDRIIKVGSPMREVIEDNKLKIESSDILTRLKLTKNLFFLVSCHREEIIDNNSTFNDFCSILNALDKKYRFPIIISTHPRTEKKIKQSKIKFSKDIKFLKPFSFSEYMSLQKNAYIVLSDSGTINEESSILQFPAIKLRGSNERPEAMEEAATIMVEMHLERILQAINILKNNKLNVQNKIVDDYSSCNFSEKIIKTIHSYLNYVNSYVWMK